jgi:hypothetical protein
MVGSALLLLLLGQVPVPLSGTVVDREGQPLAGVEVVFSRDQAIDGTVPILGRVTTDSRGRYKVPAPVFESRPQSITDPCLFSYRAGAGLIASVTTLRAAGPAASRLTFVPAVRRQVTVQSGNGLPLAGVRLAPWIVYPRQSGFQVTLPDALVDRLEVTTGPDGRTDLACLEPTTALVAMRAKIPGFGTQVVAVGEKQTKTHTILLELKPAGRLAGRVMRDDGKPAAGVVVEVWSRTAFRALAPVKFDAGAIRTGRDGWFRTPPGLLAGANYRAVVRAPGFTPVLSECVAASDRDDAVLKLADILLKPLRSVSGRAVDRKGQPVGGAKVVAGGQSISTETDEQGRFRIQGLAADRSFLVVDREGFRIDGRVIDERESEVQIVLARFDEPAARPLTTLSSPVPLDERRRLARQVLEPFLVKVLAEGRDSPKSWALRSLMVFDAPAALQTLERTKFQREATYQSTLRRDLVRTLVENDPDEAAAVAETIPEAHRRAEAFVEICVRLPDNQRVKKRELAERALVSARAELVPKLRVWQLGEAAELLLDLGETERAKAVFTEGRATAENLGPDAVLYTGFFAARLARVDLPAALALIGRTEDPEDRALQLGNLAARIAASHPAQAEEQAAKISGAIHSLLVTLRICQNMAPADMARARRIAMGQEDVAFRIASLVFTAYGLPPSERNAARGLTRQALAEADQARSKFHPELRMLAALMPIVEQIDPALVPEFYWRTVADLGVANDPRDEYGREDALRLAALLARYDTQVASIVFEPAVRAGAVRGTAPADLNVAELDLLAVIDPRRAVALVESLPPPADLEARGANWSRIMLSAQLGRGDEAQWRRVWMHSRFGNFVWGRDVLY